MCPEIYRTVGGKSLCTVNFLSDWNVSSAHGINMDAESGARAKNFGTATGNGTFSEDKLYKFTIAKRTRRKVKAGGKGIWPQLQIFQFLY